MVFKVGQMQVAGEDITPIPEKPLVIPETVTSETVSTGNHPILIVNGKEKRVGKKSAYMLDMLTLEDE